MLYFLKFNYLITDHLYLLQLAQHNKDLALLLKPGNGDISGNQALEYYAKHTAQIEVYLLSANVFHLYFVCL